MMYPLLLGMVLSAIIIIQVLGHYLPFQVNIFHRHLSEGAVRPRGIPVVLHPTFVCCRFGHRSPLEFKDDGAIFEIFIYIYTQK